ncbi:hypothetical protein V1264_001597 [Littorina saxatilis]|uniref:Uncharacterized protein n=1 Tax=Littorina saxatilis TaxID=31220 RepID=A0AAN9C1V1_9CAEN
MAEETSSSMPSAEVEGFSPTKSEMLLPPLICLVGVCVGLVIWVLIVSYKSKKNRLPITYAIDQRAPAWTLLDNGCHDKQNKVSPVCRRSNDCGKVNLQNDDPSVQQVTASPIHLFQKNDHEVIQRIQGQSAINGKELMNILMPVTLSLGFCPLIVLLRESMVEFLWPPSLYPTPPNINDAISCFLVPAGMVYAISFGFAFQQVISGFHVTEIGVHRQSEQLSKLLTLIGLLTCITTTTRVAMLRIVKDVTLTSVSKMLGQEDLNNRHKDNGNDLAELLRLLYSSKVKDANNVNDTDLWQKSLFDRLEKLLARDEVLTTSIFKTSIHALEWAFLETLGYMTFLGMLLVQCSSYRADLAMCFITVISISLLCYVVADLDSPFYGVFRVQLHCFCDVVRRLDDEFNKAASDVMLEKSFVDCDEGEVGFKTSTQNVIVGHK